MGVATHEVISINELTAIQEDVTKLEVSLTQWNKQKQSEQEDFINKGMKNLEILSGQINTISTQLETEILKFAQIAKEINEVYHAIQQSPDPKVVGLDKSRRYNLSPLNIWEAHYLKVPKIVRRRERFFLTSKVVGLFAADGQEATQIKAKESQNRREALERWLVERRK